MRDKFNAGRMDGRGRGDRRHGGAQLGFGVTDVGQFGGVRLGGSPVFTEKLGDVSRSVFAAVVISDGRQGDVKDMHCRRQGQTSRSLPRRQDVKEMHCKADGNGGQVSTEGPAVSQAIAPMR